MKKTLLLLIAFACFSFMKFEDKINITDNFNSKNNFVTEIEIDFCGPNASAIFSSCWSGCVSVQPELTGVLEIDVKLTPRRPTAAEYLIAQELLDDFCNS